MPLQRSEVVAAAMRILDSTGLDVLTTRKLASELNVRPGALYWHVSSKQDLLDALAEKILEEVETRPLAPRESWQDGVRELVQRLRDTLLAHRDSARLLAGAGGLGLNRLRIADHLMGLLGLTGAPVAATAHGSDTLLSYVTGFVLQEQSEPDYATPDAEDGGADVLNAERFPHLAAWAQSWSPDDRRLSFAAGLEVLVGGLDRYLTDEAKSDTA